MFQFRLLLANCSHSRARSWQSTNGNPRRTPDVGPIKGFRRMYAHVSDATQERSPRSDHAPSLDLRTKCNGLTRGGVAAVSSRRLPSTHPRAPARCLALGPYPVLQESVRLRSEETQPGNIIPGFPHPEIRPRQEGFPTPKKRAGPAPIKRDFNPGQYSEMMAPTRGTIGGSTADPAQPRF